MSAEFPVSEFPKLLWSPVGVEVTAADAAAEVAYLADGYRLTAAPEPPAELPAPEPEPVVVPLAAGEVPDNEPATFGLPDDGTGEGPTFGAADDPTYGDDAQVEDGKPKKGGKKK